MKFITRLIWILVIGNAISCHAQKQNDTLYLEFNDKMKVDQFKDDSGDYWVKLEFSIFSKGDDRVTSYLFRVYNLSKDFEFLNFESAGEELNKNEIDKRNLVDLETLKSYSACDLLFLLADTKPLFLIKKEHDRLIRYPLTYLSTKRGWTLVDNSHH